MGGIYNSLDAKLVSALRISLKLEYFVETGTYYGDTAAEMARIFPKVYTIELSKELFDHTANRLSVFPNVTAINGTSPASLRKLVPQIAHANVVYWLDAHWSGGVTVGSDYECPLLDELAAIGKVNAQSVVLIDDARCFMAPPPAPHNEAQWPMLAQVVDALRALSISHKLWIINDVFVFAPTASERDVVNYSRAHGVDLHQLNARATQT